MALLEKLLHIRLFVFDLDGVLTNGKLLVMPNGEWIREMDIKDGYAIEAAVACGFHVAVISGSSSQSVGERLQKLGVYRFAENVKAKSVVLNEIMTELALKKEEVLYMGDDIPDLDAAGLAGIFSCPCDAAVELKECADYISRKAGGDGCVRDIVEKTLRVQDKWLVAPKKNLSRK